VPKKISLKEHNKIQTQENKIQGALTQVLKAVQRAGNFGPCPQGNHINKRKSRDNEIFRQGRKRYYIT
jgi:hypothetical protein